MLFVSSDAPALQQLIAETYPTQARFASAAEHIDGGDGSATGGGTGGSTGAGGSGGTEGGGDAPVASWEAGRPSGEYARSLADFEVLKLCDAIVGPVSSGYAKTAALEGVVVGGGGAAATEYNQHNLGVCPRRGGVLRGSPLAACRSLGARAARAE